MESASLKRENKISELLNDPSIKRRIESSKNNTKLEKSESENINIKENPIYRAIVDNSENPIAATETIRDLLTFTDKEESEKIIQQSKELFEYLQNHRTLLQENIISITDTTTTQEIKGVYSDLYNNLDDFEKSLKPMTDLLDAFYTLRKEGSTISILSQIKEETEKIDEINKNIKDTEEKNIEYINTLKAKNYKIEICSRNIDTYKQEKSFFGFGGIKESAKLKIAEIEKIIENEGKEIELIEKYINENSEKIKSLKDKIKSINSDGNFVKEKNIIMEILTKDNNKLIEDQKNIIEKAKSFVSKSKEKSSSVREKLENMSKYIGKISDANSDMKIVYGIFNEGIKLAEENNNNKRISLSEEKEEEGQIQKMIRERSLSEINNHIKQMNDINFETKTSIGDISSQEVIIKTMKDSNEDQCQKIRIFNTQGVAGVAERVTVTMSAINSATLTESSKGIETILEYTKDMTNQITGKEAIRNAINVEESTDKLEKVIESLSGMRDVFQNTSEIYRTNIKQLREKYNELEEISNEINNNVKYNTAINAEVIAEEKESYKPEIKQNKEDNKDKTDKIFNF